MAISCVVSTRSQASSLLNSLGRKGLREYLRPVQSRVAEVGVTRPCNEYITHLISATGTEHVALGEESIGAINIGYMTLLHDVGRLEISMGGPASAVHNTSVSYTYTVTYLSDDSSPARDVQVTDVLCDDVTYLSGDKNGDGRLAANEEEVWTFTCTTTTPSEHDDNGGNDVLRHLATVSGVNFDGSLLIEEQASFETAVYHELGSLHLDVSGPTSGRFGETVVYNYYLTYTENEDGAPLHAPSLSDSACSPVSPVEVDFLGSMYNEGDANHNDLIDQGEIWEFRCQTTLPRYTADIPLFVEHNISGHAFDEDEDKEVVPEEYFSTEIEVDIGQLVIVMNGTIEEYHGAEVDYNYYVSYQADDWTPSINIEVEDDSCVSLVPSLNDGGNNFGDLNLDGRLDVGEVWYYSCLTTLPEYHPPGGYLARLYGEQNPVSHVSTSSAVNLRGKSVNSGQASFSTRILHLTGELDIVVSSPACALPGKPVELHFSVKYAVPQDRSGCVDVEVGCSFCEGDPVPLLSGGSFNVGDTNTDGVLQEEEIWQYVCEATPSGMDASAGIITATGVVSALNLDGDSIPSRQSSTQIELKEGAGVLEVEAVLLTGVSAHHGEVVDVEYTVSFDADKVHFGLTEVMVSDTGCSDVSPMMTNGRNVGDTNRNRQLDEGERWKFACSTRMPDIHSSGEGLEWVHFVTASGSRTNNKGKTSVAACDGQDQVSVRYMHYPGTLRVHVYGDVNAPANSNQTYFYNVTYTPGNDGTPATDVVLADDLCDEIVYISGDDNGNGGIDAGETWHYKCETRVGDDKGTLTHNVQASGKHSQGEGDIPASELFKLTVTVYEICEVEVTWEHPEQLWEGQNAKYSYFVRNSGMSSLEVIALHDSACGDMEGPFDDDGDGYLGVDEVWRFTCETLIGGSSDRIVHDIRAIYDISPPAPGGIEQCQPDDLRPNSQFSYVETVQLLANLRLSVIPKVLYYTGPSTFTVEILNLGQGQASDLILDYDETLFACDVSFQEADFTFQVKYYGCSVIGEVDDEVFEEVYAFTLRYTNTDESSQSSSDTLTFMRNVVQPCIDKRPPGVLAVKYTGAEPDVVIRVYHKQDGELFRGLVKSEGVFIVESPDDHLNPAIDFHIYDAAGVNLLHIVSIHTSCSVPIYIGQDWFNPGYFDYAHLTIIGVPEGSASGGSGSGKVVSFSKPGGDMTGVQSNLFLEPCINCRPPGTLTMIYRGSVEEYNVRVTHKQDGVLFTGTVKSGQQFTVVSPDDHLNPAINIELRTGETVKHVISVHTSCSVPIFSSQIWYNSGLLEAAQIIIVGVPK